MHARGQSLQGRVLVFAQARNATLTAQHQPPQDQNKDQHAGNGMGIDYRLVRQRALHPPVPYPDDAVMHEDLKENEGRNGPVQDNLGSGIGCLLHLG